MPLVRKRTAIEAELDQLEFIFSDGSVDAYDDQIVQSGWDLTDFLRNPIALLGHDPNFPIGRWTRVRVEGNALRGHLQLAPEGTSERINEVRRLVLAGILRSCSVGFTPIESEPRPGSKRGGVRYLRQLLEECSVTTVPANSNALLQQARSLGASDALINRIFNKPPVNGTLAERQAHARASLARAREVLARTERFAKKPVMSEAAKRAKGARERAEAVLKKVDDRKKHDELVEAIVRAERERIKSEFAVPPPLTFGGKVLYEPLLMFGGKPVYRRKGPRGW
jgi:HK97 family phage prohead protease